MPSGCQVSAGPEDLDEPLTKSQHEDLPFTCHLIELRLPKSKAKLLVFELI